MAIKLVPDVNVAIGAAIDALVALRPNALKHINYGEGRYSHLFEGWKAQGQLVTARFADEAKCCRLFSSGVPLQQLVASEFDASLSSDPTYAVGEVYMFRGGSLPPGVIRKGTIFNKKANPDAQPLAIKGATYTASKDVIVLSGQTTVSVPIIATASGASGNSPSSKKVATDIGFGVTLNTNIQPSQTLFDSNLVVTNSHAAGGSATPNADRLLKRLATAFSQGRFAPTTGAIIAGALFYSGIANVAVIENELNARTVLFPTDESWAYSDTLNAAVGQYVRDNYAGFGCSIQLGQTANHFIHVEATVQLFDTNDLIDPSTIQDNITTTLTSYFNDRPDWWTWKTSAIKAAITSADRKIFACTQITVKDAVDGSMVSEPGSLVLDNDFPIVEHYYLPDNAISITFTGPS